MTEDLEGTYTILLYKELFKCHVKMGQKENSFVDFLLEASHEASIRLHRQSEFKELISKVEKGFNTKVDKLIFLHGMLELIIDGVINDFSKDNQTKLKGMLEKSKLEIELLKFDENKIGRA